MHTPRGGLLHHHLSTVHDSPCLLLVLCAQNADRFDSEIIYDRDFDYDYFGFKVGAAACDMGWAHVIFGLV